MSRLHTALRRSAAVAGLSCGVGWAAVGTPAARAETAGGWDFAAGEKKKKVVVTGASGMIGQLLLPALREKYEVVALDIKASPGVQVCDLLGPRENIRPFFKGAYAVVHSGFVPPPKDVSIQASSFLAANLNDERLSDEDKAAAAAASGGLKPADRLFAAENSNVRMAFNVYQTAVEEGVKRVVTSSSNHAADFYEPFILKGEYDMVDPDGLARSDNYYGWAKIAYENLGFMFATGLMNNGARLENVQIRIGGPRENDVAGCPAGNLTCMRRALGAYMSQRDMQQMVIKSIETEDISDQLGVPFQIFYGISGNDHGFWSIVNARKVIGYTPEDNSAVRFIDAINVHVKAAAAAGKK